MEDTERETHKWAPRSSGCVPVTVQKDISSAHPPLHTHLHLPSKQFSEARLGYRRERQGSERSSNFI